MRSTITAKSVLNMGLTVGCDTYAIIKSSDIHVISAPPSTDTEDNILSGTVETLETSGDNIEIGLRLAGGTLLIALEKQDALQNLQVGMTAYAIISPLHIIIGL
jgi:molybdate transport system regulatory protein